MNGPPITKALNAELTRPSHRGTTNGPPITKALNAELMQHRGEWVCIDKQRLLSTGGTLVEAMDAAVLRGCNDPVCFRVAPPDHARV